MKSEWVPYIAVNTPLGSNEKEAFMQLPNTLQTDLQNEAISKEWYEVPESRVAYIYDHKANNHMKVQLNLNADGIDTYKQIETNDSVFVAQPNLNCSQNGKKGSKPLKKKTTRVESKNVMPLLEVLISRRNAMKCSIQGES